MQVRGSASHHPFADSIAFVKAWLMGALELRFRVTSPELLALPWPEPLETWDATRIALRDLPVGPSRHLVRFVEADGRLWAVKELPHDVAMREYEALRIAEDHALPAVRPAGVVVQPRDDTALLVTHYLEGSWQYRRLLMRVPSTMSKHRTRLLAGISRLLVDVHRHGLFWGDCSLANTLFTRDGQEIKASLVDAETAEIHDRLSDGQRAHDLQLAVENILGGLIDVAARLGEPDDVHVQLVAEAEGVAECYRELWEVLHEEPLVDPLERHRISERVTRLNELGFEVDEVRLEPTAARHDAPLRLIVDVAGHHFHAERLRSLTGLDVGEGQATILLNDLSAHHARLEQDRGRLVSEFAAARDWFDELLTPGIERAHEAVSGAGSPIQAYCDLLEVRWLLSEQAGHDVGDEPALRALRERHLPHESAADLGFVDLPTTELPAIPTDE
jgi:hypothetical protein